LRDRERFVPNNIIFVLAGAGMLWMGWNGFNGGAPYAANIDAGIAVLNVRSPYHFPSLRVCGLLVLLVRGLCLSLQLDSMFVFRIAA
jgi:hypothetical protein